MFACKPHKCRDETKSKEKLVSPTSYGFLVWISAYILLYVQLMFAYEHSPFLYIGNQKKKKQKFADKRTKYDGSKMNIYYTINKWDNLIF